jgi:hypothetical protein
MVHLTYKNILQPNERGDGLVHWIKVCRPVQGNWATTSIKLWNFGEEENTVLFCRYTGRNIYQVIE